MEFQVLRIELYSFPEVIPTLLLLNSRYLLSVARNKRSEADVYALDSNRL